MIRLMLVDDHTILRESLCAILYVGIIRPSLNESYDLQANLNKRPPHIAVVQSTSFYEFLHSAMRWIKVFYGA